MSLSANMVTRAWMLVLAVMMTMTGCPDDSGTPPSDEQLDQVAASVRARYVELELTDERQAPALYAYPTKLTRLTPVFDVAGRLVFEASGGWLFWADLQPASRYYHEGLLISVSDDGSVLKTGATSLPPALVGDVPWELALAETRSRDARKPGPSGIDTTLTDQEAAALLAIQTPAPEIPSEPGNGCTTKRVLIAIAGEGYGDSATAAGQAKDLEAIQNFARRGGVGVSDANIHVITPAESGGALTRAELQAGIAAAEVQCCDEVILYFTGHTHPQRGLVLQEELLLTSGVNQGQVETAGEYLDATGLFEIVGAGQGGTWIVVLEASHAAPIAEALLAATESSNLATTKVKKVSVLAATADGEPALQLSDGAGLLTSVLLERTAALTGASQSFDAISTEIRDAVYPSAIIGGRINDRASYWSTFWTGDKTLSQQPLYLATVDPANACDCTTSDDCEQPNSALCRENICRQGTCVEEVKSDGTLCGIQSECNTPACTDGVCIGNPINEGLACDDEDTCTLGDTCDQAGFCIGTLIPCDDDNICTDDTCDGTGGCINTPNTEACDDGIACTIDDVCADGACGAGGFDDGYCASLLTPEQAACTVATCGSAGCSFAPRPPGACAVGSVFGTCNPGGALPADAEGVVATCGTADPYGQACVADSDCQPAIDAVAGLQPELAGSCLSASCVNNTCVVDYVAAGNVCDIGNSCSTYACDGAGHCLWDAPVTPTPAECTCDPTQPITDQCGTLKGAFTTAGACAEFHCFGSAPDGFCHVLSAAIGTACDPGADKCWAGVCGQDLSCKPRPGEATDLAAKAAVCDDASPCTTDACVGPDQIGADAAGCTHVCAPEGSVCPTDDTLVCGASAGTCGCVDPGQACLCPDPPSPCQINSCDDGSCAVIDLPDGTSCLPDPADPCTVGACEAGACNNGAAKVCDDLDDCTTDVCDAATGACVFTPTVCPADAGLDPQCQAAVCDGSNGCQAATVLEGALCLAGCGSPGTCSAAGACEGYVGEEVWCGGTCAVCQVGACDVGTGACSCVQASDGTACAGGSCVAGVCEPDECTGDGECDDLNDCTNDTCVAGSCDFAPLDGTGCDDGDVCTDTDTCTAGVCGGTTVVGCCNLDGECDDSDPCTTDTCVTNACSNVDNGTCQCTVAGDCDDSNPCTDDDCVGNACTNVDNGTCECTLASECNDNDPCTDDDCVANSCTNVDNGTCQCTMASECNDNDPCTDDDCVGNACANVDNGTCECTLASECNDNDPCTDDDCVGNVCTNVDNGTCTSCTLPGDCDDGNDCTVDDCVTGSCTNVNETDGTGCNDGDVCTDSDQCTGGVCGGSAVANCCVLPTDCDDGDACTVQDCQANACVQIPESYTVPAAGAVLPDSANATPATPMPDYLDYTGMTVFNDGSDVVATFTMAATIPADPPDTYAAGASTFADISLVLFSGSVPGDTGATYAALTGATHLLSARHEGAGWQGELRLWNDTTGMWELDAGTTVTVALNGAVATISATLSNIATCTGFKGLTQLQRDPGAVEELVWKMYTTAGTDPTGTPVDPAL